jgi:hypothetical protein
MTEPIEPDATLAVNPDFCLVLSLFGKDATVLLSRQEIALDMLSLALRFTIAEEYFRTIRALLLLMWSRCKKNEGARRTLGSAHVHYSFSRCKSQNFEPGARGQRELHPPRRTIAATSTHSCENGRLLSIHGSHSLNTLYPVDNKSGEYGSSGQKFGYSLPSL